MTSSFRNFPALLLLAAPLAACGSDAPQFFFGDAINTTDVDASDSTDSTNTDADADEDADTVPDNCGNGAIDFGEACDGAALAGATCESRGFAGGTLGCDAACAFDTSACSGECEPNCADRSCGPDPFCGIDCGQCNEGFECSAEGQCRLPEETAVCGNGAVERGEVCDGADFGALTCASLGFDGGALACAPNCLTVDTSSCESECTPECGGLICGADPVCGIQCGVCPASETCTAGACIPNCGNLNLDAGELCDATQLNGATCQSLGFSGGFLACSLACNAYDTSACTSACVPACGSRVCGPDPVCGQSCGNCGADEGCTAEGVCEAGVNSPPRIIRVSSNVLEITEGENVRFTAVVTDPDGIDDLIGGTLLDPTNSATFGSFSTSAAEGAYEIDLSWAEIHAVRAINFNGPTTREFEAEFFDVAGNRASETLIITLECGTFGACDGVCTNLGSVDDCGSCGNECASGGSCTLGRCLCPAGYGVCDGVCEDFSSTENCGGCGNTCVVGDQIGECVSGTCQCPAGTVDCGESCQPAIQESSCGDACATCDAGAVRILESGIVEYFNGTFWGGICDDSFDDVDGAVICAQFGKDLWAFNANEYYPSTNFTVDDLLCTGTESSVAECEFITAHNCGESEHVAITCVDAACTVPEAAVVINELRVNPPGNDGLGEQEFVELYTAFPFTDLSDGELVFVDGATGNPYNTVTLTGSSNAQGLYVVGGSGVANVDQSFTGPIQNGLDAVQLRFCDTTFDAVAYDTSAVPSSLGEGTVAGVPSDGSSIGRNPFSTDTDSNSADFSVQTASPGEPNGGGACGTLGLLPLEYSGTLNSSDSTYTRVGQDCAASASGSYYYEVWTFQNLDSCTYSVTASATFSVDGYLFAYDGFFDSFFPTSSCIVGNDDAASSLQSELTVDAEPGQTIVFVVTTYSASSTSNYSISITGGPL